MKLKLKTHLRLAAENWRGKYDSVKPFYKGLAEVELNDKYGFVDKTGKEVIPPKYVQVGDFHEGPAVVELNDQYGFVDKTGKEVVPPKYDYIGDFREGLAPVKLNDKWGFIDVTGKEVVPIQYTDKELPPISSLIRLGGDPNVISEQISS